MAVKTTFSKEDFSKILSNYNLGEIKKFKPFKLGAVQTNLLLETEKDKFVFRYYENRPEKYALFEVNVLQYLAKLQPKLLLTVATSHNPDVRRHIPKSLFGIKHE